MECMLSMPFAVDAGLYILYSRAIGLLLSMFMFPSVNVCPIQSQYL